MGVGRIGQAHLKALVRLRQEGLVEEVHVVDVDESRRIMAKELGADYIYGTVDEVVVKHPDAYIVATPTTTHYDLSAKLIDKAPVMVEKPATVTLQEALSLLTISKRHGHEVVPAMVERFNDTVKAAFEETKDHLAVVSIRVGKRPNNPQQYIDVAYDLAIHDIDLFINLLMRPVNAKISAIKYAMDEVLATLVIDGVPVLIKAAWVNEDVKVRQHIYLTTKGVVSADLVNRQVLSRGGVRSVEQAQEPIYLEDRNFIEHVSKGAKPFATLIDHVRCLRILEALKHEHAVVVPL